MIVDPKPDSLGWRTLVQQRGGSSKITINKLVAIGAGLVKGQPLFCYLSKDRSNRPLVLIYLDGKPRARI